MKMLKYTFFSVLSLMMLAACSMSKPSESSSEDEPSTTQSSVEVPESNSSLIGQKATDFSLKDMDGNTVKLSDYRGKKVYLKFWATWCGPCRKSMPELEELVNDEDRDFVIVTVIAPGHQGEKSEEAFAKWFEQQDFTSVPVLYNPSASVFRDYQVRSIPTEVFIDSDGTIQNVQVGVISNDIAKEIMSEID